MATTLAMGDPSNRFNHICGHSIHFYCAAAPAPACDGICPWSPVKVTWNAVKPASADISEFELNNCY